MNRCLPEHALKQRPKVIRKRPIEAIGKFSIKRADKSQMEYTIGISADFPTIYSTNTAGCTAVKRIAHVRTSRPNLIRQIKETSQRDPVF